MFPNSGDSPKDAEESALGFLAQEAKLDGSAEPLPDCAKHGLVVKPRRGDALLFWSLSLDGNMDTSSLHAGCPVVKGEKWTATKWLRQAKVEL